MYAIATLLLVAATSLIITRVATVILVATGMSNQSARFQARSAFTGAGFTTTESEEVTGHPQRRRVVMTLMLLGNAGIVAAASSLILGFRAGGTGSQPVRILQLGIGMVVLVWLSRNAWVDRHLTRLIRRFLHRYTDISTRDLAGLLDLSGSYAVSELAVTEGDWIAHATLAELGLRDEGVAVLGVTRSSGRYLGAPSGATVVAPGDVLVLYGVGEALSELDDRPAGAEGDARHQRAVQRQHRRASTEADADRAEPADRADRAGRNDQA